jgi:hypothetical protein
LETLTDVYRVLHIAAGVVSLLSGLIAMVADKKSSGHKISGKIYIGGMSLVFITGVALAYLSTNHFLFMVAFFSYQLVLTGWRSLFVGKRYKRKLKPKPVDIALTVVPGMINISLVFLGIKSLMNGNTFGWVAITFGSIGILMAVNHLRKFYRPQEGYNKLTDHLTGMGASYIAAFTAFFVTNHPSWIPSIITWLLPTAIGTILISIYVRKYKTVVKRS